jgi:general secretion pathway protein C
MNKPSKLNAFLTYGVWVLLTFVLVKILWLVVEVLWLPTKGIEPQQTPRIKTTLRYSFSLASNSVLPKAPPPIHKKPMGSIKDLTLLATYRDTEHHLAVIGKGRKFQVVGVGENIFGYRLENVGTKEVTLSRQGKEYRLRLKEKALKLDAIMAVPPAPSPKRRSDLHTKIQKDGETAVVPRALLNTYVQNMDKIWKDIGIVPEKREGKLVGFKVRFVRRHSVFDQLGLRRGDIITAIDGEPIDNFALPLEVFRTIKTMDYLNLEIKRGKREVELNYEIR